MTNAFRRVNMVMAAIAALMVGDYRAMPGVKAATKNQALEMVGGYKSNGKGKTRTHDRGGNRQYQRKAMKLRNKAKHKKACRG